MKILQTEIRGTMYMYIPPWNGQRQVSPGVSLHIIYPLSPFKVG